jgi:oligopeptide/dipeptide ABC transporter ATP-binding protein
MDNLLTVKNLTKKYPIKGGFFQRVINNVHAVSDVSLELKKGETLGLVGESGCGKSTLGRHIMLLEKPTEGKIFFSGEDLTDLSDKEIRSRRRSFQMIFQDPFSSLNPKMTVEALLSEPIKNFYPKKKKAEIEKLVSELMVDVGLRPEYTTRYPHEFSGGQRQRISIGRALASQPELVVCDEPVSALDVSIQAQILNLMIGLQEKYGFSFVFISHDLHVVRHISDRIAVMYLGRIVELGPVEEICNKALHPYTKALLSAVPKVDANSKRNRMILQGDVPSPINPPKGCAFHPRCPFADESCKKEVPKLENAKPNHQVACIKAKEINKNFD